MILLSYTCSWKPVRPCVRIQTGILTSDSLYQTDRNREDMKMASTAPCVEKHQNRNLQDNNKIKSITITGAQAITTYQVPKGPGTWD